MDMRKKNNMILETDIQDFEQKIGTSLPPEYRNFLLKYNGGRPTLYIFPETKDLYPLALSDLFGLNTEKDYDNLLHKIDIYDGRIHPSFISIGDDPGGDQFVLGIRGKFKGKVYYWDHNSELENDEFTENELPENMYLLADSFDEFIDKLEEDTEV
jgi:hypothetical protein